VLPLSLLQYAFKNGQGPLLQKLNNLEQNEDDKITNMYDLCVALFFLHIFLEIGKWPTHIYLKRASNPKATVATRPASFLSIPVFGVSTLPEWQFLG